MTQDSYEITVRTRLGFEQAVEKATEALKQEGFGVLTEIDVKATMKQKLDVDVPPYRILGACNPPLAHRALQIDPSVGLLLPCNVVVRVDGDETVISIMDPGIIARVAGHPDMAAVAKEARERLEKVADSLGG